MFQHLPIPSASSSSPELHDLRRSCATELQRSGVSMKTTQRILGHSDMSTTAKYYTGVEEKDLRDAIRRLETQTA